MLGHGRDAVATLQQTVLQRSVTSLMTLAWWLRPVSGEAAQNSSVAA
jgi:hypothetical protein